MLDALLDHLDSVARRPAMWVGSVDLFAVVIHTGGVTYGLTIAGLFDPARLKAATRTVRRERWGPAGDDHAAPWHWLTEARGLSEWDAIAEWIEVEKEALRRAFVESDDHPAAPVRLPAP